MRLQLALGAGQIFMKGLFRAKLLEMSWTASDITSQLTAAHWCPHM
jgi:hypothetical protein